MPRVAACVFGTCYAHVHHVRHLPAHDTATLPTSRLPSPATLLSGSRPGALNRRCGRSARHHAPAAPQYVWRPPT